MKFFFYLLGMISIVFVQELEASEWKPLAGLSQNLIWPSQPPNTDETSTVKNEELKKSNLVIAGKAAHTIHNVTQPTFTVYRPTSNNTEVGIIVFPGGGYKSIAIDIEGSEVCEWLMNSGITCILLKYRAPNSGCHYDQEQGKHITPKVLTALQDAQRVISIVRYNAKKYKINPNKIGVMGFSAGGNLAVLASTRFKKRSYKLVDKIDKVSSRPDFVIPVFPGHMTMEHKNMRPIKLARNQLNTDIPISSEIPPTMLVHAEDDKVNPSHYSKIYFKRLRKVGVDVKLHLYKTGGHAFGVRTQGKESDRWMQDSLNWLNENKFTLRYNN